MKKTFSFLLVLLMLISLLPVSAFAAEGDPPAAAAATNLAQIVEDLDGSTNVDPGALDAVGAPASGGQAATGAIAAVSGAAAAEAAKAKTAAAAQAAAKKAMDDYQQLQLLGESSQKLAQAKADAEQAQKDAADALERRRRRSRPPESPPLRLMLQRICCPRLSRLIPPLWPSAC